MNEYRLRASGALVTLADIRAMHDGKIVPDILSNQEFELFGIDPVLPSAAPVLTQFQDLARDGVVLDGLGNWVQKWRVVDWSPDVIDAAIAVLRQSVITAIDRDTDAIYSAAIGNRGMEYDKAYTQACAFKTAQYQGDIPASVSSWASAKGWTAPQATDDILAAAASLDAARDAIRAHRLSLKEQARVATTYPALTTIAAQWNAFVVSTKSQLGI